jgi:hypothetical protein
MPIPILSVSDPRPLTAPEAVQPQERVLPLSSPAAPLHAFTIPTKLEMDAIRVPAHADAILRASLSMIRSRPVEHTHPIRRALADWMGRFIEDEDRVDHLLALAESGHVFSNTELLALQAEVYRTTLELDLASKVVEKGVDTIKQLMNTQV